MELHSRVRSRSHRKTVAIKRLPIWRSNLSPTERQTLYHRQAMDRRRVHQTRKIRCGLVGKRQDGLVMPASELILHVVSIVFPHGRVSSFFFFFLDIRRGSFMRDHQADTLQVTSGLVRGVLNVAYKMPVTMVYERKPSTCMMPQMKL